MRAGRGTRPRGCACPLIEVEAIGPDEIDVAGYDWVVVTSPYGARSYCAGARKASRAWRRWAGHRRALATGVEPALVPRVSSQEGLLPSFRARPAASLRRRGGARPLRRRARRRLRAALPNERAAAGRRCRRATWSCSRRPRPRAPARASASSLPASRSGRRRRGGGRGLDSSPRRSARPRRPRRGRCVGRRLAPAPWSSPSSPTSGFRTIRRHVPRRDQAHRARGGDHRHHPRDPAAARAAGRARARQHAPLHARGRPPRGGRPRSRRGPPRRSRCARPTAGCSSAPTTGCSCRRPTPRRRRGGPRAREPRRTRSTPSRARSTAATSSAGCRASRAGGRAGELGPAGRPGALVRLDLPAAGGRPEPDPAVRALHRPLRERAAEPDARAPRSRSGVLPGVTRRARLALDRYYAVVSAHVRRRARPATSSSTRTPTGTSRRDQRRQRAEMFGRGAGEEVSIELRTPDA